MTAAFAGPAFSGAILTKDPELMKGLVQSLQNLVDIGIGGLITLLMGKEHTSA
ncbi:hypothetical protein [Bradyrhizobium liaoningense]